MLSGVYIRTYRLSKIVQGVQNFDNYVFRSLKWLNLLLLNNCRSLGKVQNVVFKIFLVSGIVGCPKMYRVSKILITLCLEVIEGQILLTASWDPLDPQIYWCSIVLVA